MNTVTDIQPRDCATVGHRWYSPGIDGAGYRLERCQRCRIERRVSQPQTQVHQLGLLQDERDSYRWALNEIAAGNATDARALAAGTLRRWERETA